MKKLFAIALLALSFHAGMAAAPAANMIRSFQPDSFNHIKASHAGKPFVIMVWSLDCAYCRESFAALAEARRRRGIEVVTIATDRADDEQANQLMRKKLAASGLHSEIWAFGPAPAEQLRYAIDPKWRGELPRTYWFDANGASVAYSGVVTKDMTEKFLKR